MIKLYCLSYRFRVRWSYSGEFCEYVDCIFWLKHYCSLEPTWRTNGIKFYKIVYPNGDIEYIQVSTGHLKEFNYIRSVNLYDICSITHLYESLLK